MKFYKKIIIAEKKQEQIKKPDHSSSFFSNSSKNLPLIIITIFVTFLAVVYLQGQQEIRQRAQGNIINTCDLTFYCLKALGACISQVPSCISVSYTHLRAHETDS